MDRLLGQICVVIYQNQKNLFFQDGHSKTFKLLLFYLVNKMVTVLSFGNNFLKFGTTMPSSRRTNQ